MPFTQSPLAVAFMLPTFPLNELVDPTLIELKCSYRATTLGPDSFHNPSDNLKAFHAALLHVKHDHLTLQVRVSHIV